MLSRLSIISALLAASGLVSSTAVQKKAGNPTLGTDTVHGCYASIGELKLLGTHDWNTQGNCTAYCREDSKPVGATNAKECYCGDKYPPLDKLVDDTDCTEPCPGYGTEACGGMTVDGQTTFTVYNTGQRVSVGTSRNETEPSPTTSVAAPAETKPPPRLAAPIQATDNAQPAAITTPQPAPSSQPQSSGGTNSVGIAVGVVVGVLVVAAFSGGAFFYMKRRRNQEIEDEHRRNAAANAFISGGGKPPSTAGMSVQDQRLDPVLVNRRMSSGSIADNQDYSRRILRVTNA